MALVPSNGARWARRGLILLVLAGSTPPAPRADVLDATTFLAATSSWSSSSPPTRWRPTRASSNSRAR